jgi:hypothetical protein
VHAEALAVMVGVTADFVFNRWIWISFHITIFGTYHGVSVIMRRAFDWKRSSVSILDVDAVPQSCIP